MMTAMIELNTDNVSHYLRDRGFADVQSVEPLLGGVSNVVFRVETDDRLLVLKQSRPQLRTEAPWFSDLSRIFREIDVMEALHPTLPDVVPEVLFRDDENYAFVMSHAPTPCRDWRSILLRGEVLPEFGEKAGRILGAIHQWTHENRRAVEPFRNQTVFDQLRIDPFYRRVSERHPDLGRPIGALIEQLRSSTTALCHGDFSPKNLLLHRDSFTLVDYETAHFGDPTFDIGFCLSHLFLKLIHLPPQWRKLRDTIRGFWHGYTSNIMFAPPEQLCEAGAGHLGACLLARVDGTSPAPYLKEEHKQEIARRLSRRFLQERFHRVEDPLQLALDDVTRIQHRE
jgi:5-methylthioribose kinase